VIFHILYRFIQTDFFVILSYPSFTYLANFSHIVQRFTCKLFVHSCFGCSAILSSATLEFLEQKAASARDLAKDSPRSFVFRRSRIINLLSLPRLGRTLKGCRFQTIDEIKEETLEKLSAETDYEICLESWRKR